MKKRMLLFIVMALMMTMPQQMKADIEINELTFPDDNFRSWVSSRSYGKDDVLTDNYSK